MLTDSQRLLLFAVLAAPDGRALQKDLRPAAAKADRDALTAAGLLAATKRGRALWLEITEAGAVAAEAELEGKLPDGAQALHFWLGRLKAYLNASGLRLADILAPLPRAAPELHTTAPDLRSAYLTLTGGELNQRVRLKDLRARLGDGAAVDAALGAAHGRDGLYLSGSDNPPELTPDDRAAALVYKGEPMHFVWITR
jgi:hypothetical protein